MILGFDLGLHLGWSAIGPSTNRVASGRQHLPASPRARRWTAAAELFANLAEKYFPVAVVYERPVGGRPGRNSRATFIVHGALLAMLEVEAHRRSLPEPIALSPAEWKRAVVGKGTATKVEYIAAANERFGLHLDHKGEDEAAALLIGCAAIKLGKVPS